jgi:phage tail protein X
MRGQSNALVYIIMANDTLIDAAVHNHQTHKPEGKITKIVENNTGLADGPVLGHAVMHCSLLTIG